jgi:hypothetical protein
MDDGKSSTARHDSFDARLLLTPEGDWFFRKGRCEKEA